MSGHGSATGGRVDRQRPAYAFPGANANGRFAEVPAEGDRVSSTGPIMTPPASRPVNSDVSRLRAFLGGGYCLSLTCPRKGY